MVRILIVINLLISVSLNGQMMYLQTPSYGGAMDSVINSAKNVSCTLPSEYYLKQLQYLIEQLKANNKWNDILHLYCFEHDGNQMFSKINLKNSVVSLYNNGGSIGVDKLVIGDGSGNKNEPVYINKTRDGIKNTIDTTFGYNIDLNIGEERINWTVGLIMQKLATVDQDTGMILGFSQGQYTTTRISASVINPNTYGFKGIVTDSLYEDTTRHMSIGTDNAGYTTPVAVTRLSLLETTMESIVQGNLYSPILAHSKDNSYLEYIYWIRLYYQTLPRYGASYVGNRRIKFIVVAKNTIRMKDIYTYFDTYSRNVPDQL